MEIWENRNLENLIDEIWKTIEDYPDYQISNFGRIKSLKFRKEKILKQIKTIGGYLCINLYKNGKGEYKQIHTLIFETFNNYKLKDYECVHHINEDKINNILDNFKLITKSEHTINHHSKLKYSKETRIKMSKNHANVKGEKHPRSILTEKKVIEIWKYLDEEILTQKEIAKYFKVSEQTISYIKNRKSWKHIIIEGEKYENNI